MDHEFERRADDLTSTQRIRRLENLAMSEPDSGPQKVDGTWSEWQRFVLAELKAHRIQLQKLDDNITKLRIEVAVIKTKNAMYGAAAGLLAAALMNYLTKGRP